MAERDIVERLKDLVPFSLDGDPAVHVAAITVGEIVHLRAVNADLLEALHSVLANCQVAAPLNLGRWDDEYYSAFNQAVDAIEKATKP